MKIITVHPNRRLERVLMSLLPGALVIALALLPSWAAGGDVFEDAVTPALKKPAIQTKVEPWEDAEKAEKIAPQPPPKQKPVPSDQKEPWEDTAKEKESSAPPTKAMPSPRPAVKKQQSPDFGEDQKEIERWRQAKLSFTQALDEFNAGRYEKSAQLFERYLAVFPLDAQARKYLAMAQEQARAARLGVIKVTSLPEAEVFIDGQLRGRTPLTVPDVPAGPHRVEARAGKLVQQRNLLVKPRTTYTVEFDLRRIEVSEKPKTWGTAYTHPRIGFKLAVPPGWKVADQLKKHDLRIRSSQGEALIQVNSWTPAQNMTPLKFAEAWEKKVLGPKEALRARLSGRRATINRLPCYIGVYQGPGVRTQICLIRGGKRLYMLLGIFRQKEYAGRLPTFHKGVESFSP